MFVSFYTYQKKIIILYIERVVNKYDQKHKERL